MRGDRAAGCLRLSRAAAPCPRKKVVRSWKRPAPSSFRPVRDAELIEPSQERRLVSNAELDRLHPVCRARSACPNRVLTARNLGIAFGDEAPGMFLTTQPRRRLRAACAWSCVVPPTTTVTTRVIHPLLQFDSPGRREPLRLTKLVALVQHRATVCCRRYERCIRQVADARSDFTFPRLVLGHAWRASRQRHGKP